MTPIVIVGEAWGAEEARIGKALVGPSGVELLRQLDEADIIRMSQPDRTRISRYYTHGDQHALDEIWEAHSHEVYRTNVLQFHPPGNDLNEVCGTKAEGIPGYPAIIKGKYLRHKFETELERLSTELLDHNPNLIICLGNTALWALCGSTGISKLRGTTFSSTLTVADFKCMGMYHPAAVLRQWELRPTTIMDLVKAKRESVYPQIRRPNCEIYIDPSLEDIEAFITTHIIGCDILSTDIETAGNRITCIGFAPRADLAIVIPFDDSRKSNGCYWPTELDEKRCWEIIRRVLEDISIPKLFQNGVYDIGFLARSYGILVKGAAEDTMLAHHAIQPESLKGLGYLGSIYTDHGSWKHMRKKHETVKREE